MPLLYGASGDVREELLNPTEQEVSANLLNLARTRATHLVDSYLEKKFPSKIPFATSGDVPGVINFITNDLAVFFVKRSTHPGPRPMTDDDKKLYYDDNVVTLEKIVKGEIQIPELSTEGNDPIEANRSGYTPVFDIDEIENNVIDPDLEDKISDDRE